MVGLFGQTLPGFLRPSPTRGECQPREPASARGSSQWAPSFPRGSETEKKDGAARAPPPRPFPSPLLRPRRGCSREAGIRTFLTFFSAGTSNPRHLGAFSSLKNSYGSCCACMVPLGRPGLGGGGGGPAGEPREGELAARNRAAAPPDGPAPSGRRAAGLAPDRGLRDEARGRPPTRHGHQPQRANAARRRRRRHPAPPPRGRAPLHLPGPPAPPRAALRRGRRPPARRGCAPGPGLAPRRSRRLGEGVWRDAPAAAPAQRSRDRETPATPGGAEPGPGSSGGGERPEVVVGESGCPEVPPRPPPTRV